MRTIAILVVGILMFFSGLVSGMLLPTMMTSNTTLAVQETWDLTNVTSAEGANGWIAITVNNTGIVPVTFVKASVNLVAQSTSPSLPLTLQTNMGTVLNITVTVDPNAHYDIRVYTSRGNYSEIQWTPPIIMGAGVRLFKLNVNFYTQNGTKKIDIDVGNSGTSDTQIILFYTGTSSTTLQNQTTTPTLPAALRAGSTQRIMINYNWTSGVTYYFKVVSSAGQTLEWPEQAPSQ